MLTARQIWIGRFRYVSVKEMAGMILDSLSGYTPSEEDCANLEAAIEAIRELGIQTTCGFDGPDWPR